MCLNNILDICKNIIEEEDKMKTKKIFAITFGLAILVLAVGCTANDTGLNNNQDRLSTQTRINRDWNLNNDMGMDNQDSLLDNRLNTNLNNGINNNLNNGMVRNNNNRNRTNNQNTKASELADEITSIPEVEDASVVLNNNSCIVGVDLDNNNNNNTNNNNNNNNNISASLRNRIEKIIKNSTNISTDNISITADSDLLERITSLSDDMANTVGNDFNEFTNDIEDLVNDIVGGRRVR